MLSAAAEIVIIGGGAIGCSIAYHLAAAGKRDVILLEKSALTHGSTWHAAGLVGQLRSQRNLTRMLQYSTELYGRLEAETGQATDWRPVGSLRVASSRERWREIQRTATAARSFGFELHLLGPLEAAELFPAMDTRGIVGAAWIPSDGHVDPSGLTQALARGARRGGVTIHEGVAVTGFEVRAGRVTALATDHGTIACEVVVNAAGIWAREVGALAGVAIPAAAVEHQYVVTERVEESAPGLPTLRDPDHNFYLKADGGGFAFGGWEEGTATFAEHGVAPGFGRELLPSNHDRFAPIAVGAATRVPVLGRAGVRTLINGPIPISPDGEPVMGPAPELANFHVACGFTAGIAGCGGAGRAVAQWIVDGDPGMDLWAFDIRRFTAQQASRRWLHERAVESYGRYYQLHRPGEEPASARGARRSPLHGALASRGAVFGSKAGWERANWFAPAGVEPRDHASFERPGWFEHVAAEHRAVRERVALIDQSSFAKLEVSGPGAARCLARLAANDVDREPGAVVYTQLCNERGGVEADVTVTRLAEDRFYIVTGAGFAVRDGHWIRRHLPADGSARLDDVTAGRAVVNVCGPRSRELLGRVADGDVDGDAFPFMSARTLEIGYATVLALRVTYVGELGYELHLPVEHAGDVYERLRAAGEALGVADVGYRALDSLRLEKGYCYWSAELGPERSPYEAGLGFCVALDRGDFLGREALARIHDRGVSHRLCHLTADMEGPLHGGEAIVHQGRIVGVTTSGGFGHTIGRAIALGYLAVADAADADYEIEIMSERVPATRHARALYDPERSRILA